MLFPFVCVHQYIEDTEQEAMEALQKNEHILRRLTEELLAKTKLSGSVSVLIFPLMVFTEDLTLENLALFS